MPITSGRRPSRGAAVAAAPSGFDTVGGAVAAARSGDDTADPRATDHVGWIMAQWRRERPDLEVAPQGVIGRLHRLGQYLNDELVPVMREHGLGEGEFDVLATLRRSGGDYTLSVSELVAQTMVTSGAVSKRIDRLVDRGLLTRTVSAEDARGRRIALTDRGRETIDRAFTAHIANENRLVSLLTETERAELAALLARWLTAFER